MSAAEPNAVSSLALTEPQHARAVHQLGADLNHIARVTDDCKRRQHHSQPA